MCLLDVSGFLLNFSRLFEPLEDDELFNDDRFWTLPSDAAEDDNEQTDDVELALLGKDGDKEK